MMSNTTQASRALDLLSSTERAAVLRYFQLNDAKMSLASHLLKRYVISRYADVPWDEATATRNEKGKPIYLASDGREPLAFNVSHQAGMLALAAVAGYEGGNGKVDVGVDVVSPTERRERDLKMIEEDGRGNEKQGWIRFVKLHEEVFADDEADYLKSDALLEGWKDGEGNGDALDYRLRCFYTLWCLREAYIKMTGDALLAEWLKSLSFEQFRPPQGAMGLVEHFDIWFKLKKVKDARMRLKGMGKDYMVGTAVRTPDKPSDALNWRISEFQELELDEILDFAEAARQ
jgi:4'-phosphopantetheinyl transferase